MKYRSDVDGLRAVAVVLVVLFHISLPGVTGGYIGVDVFFVISGFLITSIIKADIEAGCFSLLRFYDRRIRRIFPALVAVYLFCVFAAALVLFPNDMMQFGKSLAASAFFVSNFLFYGEAGYFAAPSHDKPLLHTWSLSVEEQFYVVWPLILLAVFRFANARVLKWLVVAGLLGSLAIAEWQLAQDRAMAFYLMPARAWELGLGALLALRQPDLGSAPRLRDLVSLAGMGLILASAFVLTESSDFPGLHALPACLGTAMLIVSGVDGQGIVNRLLSQRAVVFVGLISYSLYLWHWPMIVFGRYYLDRDFGPLEAGAVIAAGFVAAVLSYRFIESPFRHPPRRPAEAPRVFARSPRRTVTVGLAAATVGGLLGISMVVGGWSWRLPESALKVDRLSAESMPFRTDCHGQAKALVENPACTLGRAKSDGDYDLVVIGDSHAEHLVAGLDKLLKREGLSGRQVTTPGCPPLLDVRIFDQLGRESCEDFAFTIRAFLDRHPEVKVVVLSARWALYSETRWLDGESDGRRFLVDDRDESRSRENTRRVVSESLERTVEEITARGMRVLLFAQVPPLSGRRTRCMTRARWLGKDESQCYEPSSKSLARTAFVTEVISRLAASSEQVDAFFPGEILCREELCVPVLDGVFLFRDEDHLNPTGSELLLSRLVLPIKN